MTNSFFQPINDYKIQMIPNSDSIVTVTIEKKSVTARAKTDNGLCNVSGESETDLNVEISQSKTNVDKRYLCNCSCGSAFKIFKSYV